VVNRRLTTAFATTVGAALLTPVTTACSSESECDKAYEHEYIDRGEPGELTRHEYCDTVFPNG
jgi:hypothetical protein